MSLYLCLAFSTGRLRHASDRRLLATLVFVLALFFGASCSSRRPSSARGRLAECAAACPENPFQVGSASQLLDHVGDVRHLRRARGRRRHRRRLGPAIPGRDEAAATKARPGRGDVAAARAVVVRLLLLRDRGRGGRDHTRPALVAARRHVDRLPARFRVALLQADLFAGQAFRRLLSELASRPTPEGWHASRGRCARRSVAPARVLGSGRRALPRRGAASSSRAGRGRGAPVDGGPA